MLLISNLWPQTNESEVFFLRNAYKLFRRYWYFSFNNTGLMLTLARLSVGLHWNLFHHHTSNHVNEPPHLPPGSEAWVGGVSHARSQAGAKLDRSNRNISKEGEMKKKQTVMCYFSRANSLEMANFGGWSQPLWFYSGTLAECVEMSVKVRYDVDCLRSKIPREPVYIASCLANSYSPL